MDDIPGAGDWLSNEKFDFNFNLNLSKSSAEGEDDEEVFIGPPVTGKEKCMAVIVQEKENIRTLERLNTEEQALILREAALINLKIKSEGMALGRRNTTMSPAVAIVHPMRRKAIQDDEENKENEDQRNNIQNDTKEITNMSSQSSKGKTKRVPMPIKPSKSLTAFSHQSLSSASGSGTKLKNIDQQKRLKKQLAIPKPGSISKSKSGGGIPSLLPSRPKQFFENSSNTKSIKPSIQSSTLKVAAQATSSISQMHLKLSARKCSDVTPIVNKLQAKSSQRLSLGGNVYSSSLGGTPNNRRKAKNKPSEKTPAEHHDLISPIVHSSRRSIVGRQLIPEVTRLKTPSVDKFNQTNMQEPKIMNKVQPCQNSNINVAPTEEIDPSHTDTSQIDEKPLNQTNSIQEPKRLNNVQLDENRETHPAHDTFHIDKKTKNINNEFMLQENEEYDKNETNDNTNMKIIGSSSDVVNNEINDAVCTAKMLHAIPSPRLLIDIFDCVEPVVSPVKLNKLDPFETGNTPPPLIQLDVVLQPEKLQEVNLIKF